MNLLDRVAPTTLGKAPAWLPVALQGRPRSRRPGMTGMGQGQPRHSSGHYENRWSEVHPEANLRDGQRIDGSPVPGGECAGYAGKK